MNRIKQIASHLNPITNTQPSGDIGLIGLAVMGQNLILNAADHGFTVVAYNRTVSKVDHFIENEAKGKSIIGAKSIQELVDNLKRPRRIILLVKAGAAVDAFIEQLLPYLEKDDIIIDGGNSHYPDSNRRYEELKSKGIHFVGSGVSGGEEGARYGPSLMPGGAEEAWPHIKDIFQSIAAKSDGEPCCDWVGPAGAGHYVKMVHNGIEYGDMQLISEAYDILKRIGGFTNKEIGDVFAQWNKGVLDSFLIEITRDILYYNDPADGTPLLEKILDSAGQKGTGKWTAINALDLGTPVTLIGEAVFARCLSSIKDERVAASKILPGPEITKDAVTDRKQFVDDLEQALYASKIISYAQGFMLIREAAKEYGWKLNNPAIALMWRGGCIIRSVFLAEITAAYRENPDLENLLFNKFFSDAITKAQSGWRSTIALTTKYGIPTPAFSTALSFYDGYRSAKLPANLLQAQRDYFGAHTFKVLPEFASETLPKDQYIHINWTGRGGDVSATTYDA
ncbi:6-phosphogluconate dehydrogenase [Wickerhamomyces ciferrii]|uniref:6-phosphogluconate dehydrogenase, decarboxylating n=1 Tax=Wickerhamomyces ciferrii (strain ATCC 14091 / BCRC 22168 / CBS 111 / JCM 3599 / NBRC 0793 / NRRL Y-1031 F-60-10) TaxID=1206466 RepID=K0KMZ4_WICCF|nr:6-phosphogluconate dehydrogenase [Wickerhamomyces ciferrii]CCH42498.1 6-phosphogluconate dehydrogenase [Wickerhamomyces ciferrii]